jgi:uncharacterized membrane protein
VETNALVRDYLTRLETAAVRLPAGRRTELVGEIREHIDAAIADAGTSDETAVRNVLDRLGSPEDIVGAETRADAGQPEAAARPRIGPLEVVAVLLVTIGAFVAPIVGPAVGIGLVWLSRALTTRQKLVLTAIVVVVVILPIVLLLGAGGGGGGGPVLAP